MNIETLAHQMYDEYCRSVGGKTYDGKPLPKSCEFFSDKTKKKQADAWREVSSLAIKKLT